jgi:hypothetical protein
MGRIGLLGIAPIAVIFFLIPGLGITQMTEGTGAVNRGSETTVQGTQNQPNAPYIDSSGIVYPRENLDPFGLSTIGESTESGQREAGSTFGRETKRKSNLEVNKPRGKEKGEETTAEEGAPSTEREAGSEPVEGGYTTPGKRGVLYTWRDEKGVVHVTNDLGSVPPKYQDQMLKGYEETGGKGSSKP